MAIVYAALVVYDIVRYFMGGAWFMALPIIASLLNFIIFFLGTRNLNRYNPKEIHRRNQFKRAMGESKTVPFPGGSKSGEVTKHKCAVCGRTEKDDPNLEFRFCSKCNGNYEYCQDHLYTHITQEVKRRKDYYEKVPFVTLDKLQEITAQFPTPFHLYDEKGIRENAKAVKEAFAWNKGFKEFFAVKATPNPFLIQILQEYGCGCDCSSMTELMMSKAIGCKEGDIMFSSNDTPEEEFKYANEIGGIINLDDITHIESVERAVGYIPKVISCRYNPGGVFKISNDIMDNPGDAKYGMTTEQIFEAFKILKEKGAEEFGIHAFLASNTVTNEYYPMLAKEMFEMAVKLQKETGAHVKFINLSGGVGIAYKPDQTPNDIREIGEGVRKVYEEVLVPAGMGDVAIYTEMGRFMMGPYGCLVTKAIHEKHTHKEYIGVDACAVNLMRPAMYGAYHHITVMGKEDQPCDHMYDVTGSLCENNDKFAIDRYLPKVDMGDLLVIHDTGAHGFAMGYNYNGKLKSSEILLHEDGSFEMIRRAETPKDYFATFDCFPIYEKLLEDME